MHLFEDGEVSCSNFHDRPSVLLSRKLVNEEITSRYNSRNSTYKSNGSYSLSSLSNWDGPNTSPISWLNTRSGTTTAALLWSWAINILATICSTISKIWNSSRTGSRFLQHTSHRLDATSWTVATAFQISCTIGISGTPCNARSDGTRRGIWARSRFVIAVNCIIKEERKIAYVGLSEIVFKKT